MTAARLDLFRAVKEQPDSTTGIATRLHRDRSAVKRDVDQLAAAGLIEIESEVLPGHGRMKRVRAAANQPAFAPPTRACSVQLSMATMRTAAIWICWSIRYPVPHCSILRGLQVELEELLGVPVDLLTPGDLPVKFRAQVLAEARPV